MYPALATASQSPLAVAAEHWNIVGTQAAEAHANGFINGAPYNPLRASPRTILSGSFILEHQVDSQDRGSVVKKLGAKGRKWALSFHLVFVGTWFGSAVAMVMLIALRPPVFGSDGALVAYCNCVAMIDDFIIIAAAGGTWVTGTFLAWRTNWGLFKWYWVALKFISTTAMVLFGAICLGPWITETATIARSAGLDALQDARFHTTTTRSLIWGTVQTAVLAGIIFLSIFKPWGRIATRNTRQD